METSTEDKEENAELEKCTIPSTRKLENGKNKSPKEQPRETSTFYILRDNDTKNDNMKAHTKSKEQSSTNTSADHEQSSPRNKQKALPQSNRSQDENNQEVISLISFFQDVESGSGYTGYKQNQKEKNKKYNEKSYHVYYLPQAEKVFFLLQPKHTK